jgi:hypothetical protein
MPSRIDQNRARLLSRHYIRNATAANHWFDFAESKLKSYRARYGDDFCLIINGSHSDDDTYIIPFSVARITFTDNSVDGRHRWVGTIKGSQLHLSNNGTNMDAAPYYNAFQLIGV